MFNIHREELDWGGRKLVLETGRIARQADGAVFASYGETTVLATVVAAKKPKEGVDFIPLTCNYQEKFFAAGRIPGGYFKREGRPTERETLTSRLMDRPIRPLFADGWRCDTQVIATCMSHDQENDPDILAMVAASAALTLSGVPFMGPVGAARVGFINNEYVLNPQGDEMTESNLHLVVAGTGGAGLMVESEAKELPEEVMLGAVMFGHRHFQPVIEAIIRLAEKAAKEPRDLGQVDNTELEKEMLGLVEPQLRSAYAIPDKMARHAAVDAAKATVMAHFYEDGVESRRYDTERVAAAFKELEAKIVRWNILDTGRRIDGRDLQTVRPIVCEVGVLPRTHGSALFTRGETQALVIATLGTGEDELGDMDFKVAGTERGVTSLQMDIKISGINEEIMRVALGQAKDGRLHILGEMAKALVSHRAELGAHAPRIEVISIPVDKIREVIGSGGKVIREIVEKSGAKIDISDDGTIKIASANADSIKAAINWIKSIASEPEVGQIYDGTVVKVVDFGAFVNFFGSKDGLVHISQLAPRRVQKVTDVVKEGDKVKVKLLGFDERGKVRLSMKVVDQATGEDLEAKQKAEGDTHREAAGGE